MIISRSSLPKYVTKTSKTISNDRQNSLSMWRSYCFFYQRKCLRNKNVCRSATRYWGCIPDRIINRNTLMALIFVRWNGAIITFESIEAVVREWTVLFRLIIPGHSHLSNYWLWRFRFKNHLSIWFCSSFLLPSLINANVEKILHVLEPFNSSWPNYVLIPGIFSKQNDIEWAI